MTGPSLIDRLKQARIVQVLVVYLGASWVVLQLVDTLIGLLSMPQWVGPLAVVLMGIGLMVVLATAWVQSLPSTTAKEEAGEIPTDWQVAPAEALASIKAGKLPHLTWGRALMGGAFALALLLGAGGAYVLITGGQGIIGPTAAGAEASSSAVAVLPFEVRGEGLDVYGEGMVDLLTTNLQGLGGLRAINAGTVVARWRAELGAGTSAELEQALRVAGGLDARFAVRGSAVNAGGRVRLAAEVFDLADGSRVEGVQAEGSLDEMLGLVDALTVQLAAVFVGDENSLFRGRALATKSLPALEAYLRGEAAYRALRLEDATAAYREAAQADPDFALAWWRLSEAWGWVDPGEEEGLAALSRALGLSEDLPERERVLLRADAELPQGRNGGVAALRSHLNRHPDDAEAWNILGEFAAHVPWLSGAPEGEMAEAFARAADLIPTFSPYYVHLIGVLIADRREEEFQALVARARKANPEDEFLDGWQPTWDFFWGTPEEQRSAESYFNSVPITKRNALSLLMLQNDASARNRQVMPFFPRDAWEGSFPFQIAAVEVAAGVSPERWNVGRASRAPVLVHWALITGEAAPHLQELQRSLREDPLIADVVSAAVLAALAGDRPAAESALDLLPDTAWSGPYGMFGGAASPEEARRSVEAIFLLQAGDHRNAVQLLSQTLGQPAYDPLAVWLMGEAQAGMGNWDEALRFYETILRSAFRPHVRLAMGRVLEAKGDTAAAREAYQGFLTMWADADPALRPVVEAKEALARIGG